MMPERGRAVPPQPRTRAAHPAPAGAAACLASRHPSRTDEDAAPVPSGVGVRDSKAGRRSAADRHRTMGHEGYGVFHDELGCVSTTCPHFPRLIKDKNSQLPTRQICTTNDSQHGNVPRPRIQPERVIKRSGPSPKKFRRPLSISGQARCRRLPLDDGYCAQLGVLARYSLTDRAEEREADEVGPCSHAPSSRSARLFWFTVSRSAHRLHWA